MLAYLMAIFFLYNGIKRYKNGVRSFSSKQLFEKVSLDNSSGTLLIVEGLTGLVLTILMDVIWLTYLFKK